MGVPNDGRSPFLTGPGCSEKASSDLLLYRFYYQMYFIRLFEEQCLLRYVQCPLPNRSRASVGLEACDVGVINALDGTRDFIFSAYRAHSHFIAYSDDISGFSGKSIPGPHRPGSDRHLRRFNMCSKGGESNLIQMALDVALACKCQATGAICTVFLNQESVGPGVMQEIGNISSLWSLPLLFVLTECDTAPNMGRSGEQSENDIANIFNSASQFIVADDVFKVYAFARAAVAYVRNNCSPFLLRLQAKCAGSRQGEESMPAEERSDECAGSDPIERIARQLTPQARELIESFAQERMREAVAGA